MRARQEYYYPDVFNVFESTAVLDGEEKSDDREYNQMNCAGRARVPLVRAKKAFADMPRACTRGGVVFVERAFEPKRPFTVYELIGPFVTCNVKTRVIRYITILKKN